MLLQPEYLYDDNADDNADDYHDDDDDDVIMVREDTQMRNHGGMGCHKTKNTMD